MPKKKFKNKKSYLRHVRKVTITFLMPPYLTPP